LQTQNRFQWIRTWGSSKEMSPSTKGITP
jgi:hypothetical protein